MITDLTKTKEVYAALMACKPENALVMPGGISGKPGARKIDWFAYPKRQLTGLFAFPGLEPYYKPKPQEVLLQALHYACLVIEKHLDNGKIYLRGADLKMAEIDDLLRYWSKDFGITEKLVFGGYDVKSGDVDAIRKLFNESADAAKEITLRLAQNISAGNLMCKEANELVAEILCGWCEQPGPTKGQRAQTHRDTLLIIIAEELRHRAGYHLSANNEAFAPGKYPKPCGCTIAAAALTAYGMPVRARMAAKIFSKKQKHPVEQAAKTVWRDILEAPRSTFGLRADADLSDKVADAMYYFSVPI